MESRNRSTVGVTWFIWGLAVLVTIVTAIENAAQIPVALTLAAIVIAADPLSRIVPNLLYGYVSFATGHDIEFPFKVSFGPTVMETAFAVVMIFIMIH